MSELVVVAVQRQVEIVSREGVRAETRRRLGERLAAALLHDTRFANAACARAALAAVLPRALEEEAAIARLSRSAGAWERLVDAIDDALDAMRASCIDARALGAVEADEPMARILRRAMNALDARLERAGLVDERLRWERLGRAIERAPVEEIVRVVSARQVRARFVHRWTAADAAWWKAMSTALARASGGASIELPIVAKPIDATRASDPFEVLASDVARLLDEAPVFVDVTSPFGDLGFTSSVPRDAVDRVVIRHALDAEAQARAVARLVGDALDDGVATDRVAIALPHGTSGRSKRALLRHFEDMDVPLHLADVETESTLLEVAFELLQVGAEGLPRVRVAEILRSRALDAEALSGVADVRAARAVLFDLAGALERNPTADGDDAIERFVATASAGHSARRDQRAALARRVANVLTPLGSATRAAHARRARALFAQVGLAARAGGAVRAASARDEAPNGLVGAERDAYARDARALEALTAALGEVERAGGALGDDEACTVETFAHELARAMRTRGAMSAARAGAVRAMGLAELAGEPLELLVVVDANDGVLPARATGAGLATSALEDALRARDGRRATGDVAARELVELAAAASGARRVALCHRASDDDGAALAPSPVVSWLERGGVAAELVHSAPLMGIPTTAHERELALVAVATPAAARELAPHAAHVAARELERESVHATGDTTPARLDMTDELRTIFEIETGGAARPLSITAVERLARCPFQGFAAHILGAIDDDARTDDMPDQREEGILAHEALGAAFTAASSLWSARPRDRGAIERVAFRAAEEVLARDGGALVRAALDRIHSEVVRIVSLAIDDDEWNFAFAERGFGNAGDEWPAMIIERDGARLALRGRTDRIDLSRDGTAVRAVDYKRRVSLPAIVELGVTAIQVPLYALVAKRALGISVARGRYLSTISPAITTTRAFEDRFADLVAEDADSSTEATRFALDRVRALREGDIGPNPNAAKWCQQCGLDAACRRPRFAVTMVGREENE